MKELKYTVRFITPAFLGDAEQKGQWRTPPFKALIRQWWRVVKANGLLRSGCNPATLHAYLREAEGQLFGTANDEGGGSQKSQVRLRLDAWSQGKLQGAWGNDPRVNHPEVGPNGRDVGAHLYLGYGPLEYRQGGTAIKNNAAIQANESATLWLAWPEDKTMVADTIQLAHWFGSLGGRSRNGWGSLSLEHASIVPIIPAQAGIQNGHLLRRVSFPLTDCLRHDWPHALGQGADGCLLIWKSAKTFANWRETMQALAKAKIGFRMDLKLSHGEMPHQTKPAHIPFEDRHLLAYPVTHHAVAGWAEEFGHGRLKYDRQGWVIQSTRLANQLRFKVAKNAEGRLVAYIFHLPCALPHELAQALGHSAPTVQQQVAIWNKVHTWIDNTNQSGFQRI